MKSRKTDDAYLWDMREASLEALDIVAGKTAEEFQRDTIRVRAVERLIEIVGEAASHVSRETRLMKPDVPWEKIIAQRHVLAHAYGEIDYKRLYEVVAVHVSPLILQLDGMGLEPSLLRPTTKKENA